MGDLKTSVGHNNYQIMKGKFGLCDINERGGKIIEFCELNEMVIMNTFFEVLLRRQYTWKAPRNISKH